MKDLLRPLSGRPLSSRAVRKLETALGVDLPLDYRNYLLHETGAYVEGQVLTAAGHVLPMSVLYGGSARGAWIERIGRFKLLGIGEDLAGNRIALSFRKHDFGSVHFWDHETDELTFIGVSFSDLLDRLQPEPEISVGIMSEPQVTGYTLTMYSDEGFEDPHELVYSQRRLLGYEIDTDKEWIHLLLEGPVDLESVKQLLADWDGSRVVYARGDWSIEDDIPSDQVLLEWCRGDAERN